MKKILLIMAALAMGFGLNAQNTAPDFTATDLHGNEIHLYDILDGGQYVLIDFFYTTCGPCQASCPLVVQAYTALGCNMHDVFFMEVDRGDTEAACQTWVTTYGVEYPTIAGETGGTEICSQYGINAYPTIMLIAPDHNIVIESLYPISSAQTIIDALAPYGIEEHDCSITDEPFVDITIDEVTETEITATFTPNDYCETYYYLVATTNELNNWIYSGGLSLAEAIVEHGLSAEYEISQTFMDLTPNIEYSVCAVGADADGNLYSVSRAYVVTTPGGYTDIAPDFTATDIDGNEIHLYDILDNGQAVVLFFFVFEDPTPDIIPFVTESYTDFGCNMHDVYYLEVHPYESNANCQNWAQNYNVEFPTISGDGGGGDIAHDYMMAWYPTLMIINPQHYLITRDLWPINDAQTINSALEAEGWEQHDCNESVGEADLSSTYLFPNPADGFVTLTGESLGTVRVYNTLGQEVAVFEAGDNELRINTTGFDNGVYVVKTGEKMMKFVVKH